MRQVLGYYRIKSVVHGIAHITGGGLHENLARIVPEGVQVVIERGSWPMPAIFPWLQRLGEVEQAEMDQVFNMGIGMVLVVSPYYADSIRHQLTRGGVESWPIGRVEQGRAAWCGSGSKAKRRAGDSLWRGDCPDFRGAGRVVFQAGVFAAKMGLSPLRRPRPAAARAEARRRFGRQQGGCVRCLFFMQSVTSPTAGDKFTSITS